VSSPDGQPLSGINVRVRSLTSGLVLTGYTDDAGKFSFLNLPFGNYSVRIEAPGYEPERRFVRIGAMPVFDLSFRLKAEAGKALPRGPYTISVHQLRIPEKAREEFRKGYEDFSRGRMEKAIKHWKKSIEIYPSFAESYMQLSRVYTKRGDFPRALEAAQKAVAIDDQSADAYSYLGYVYLKKKDYAEAKKAFLEAVRLSNSKWLPHFWLGWLLLKEKNASDAFAHLVLARQLRPQLPEVHILYFNDLLQLGRMKEALAELDDFLARFPENSLVGKVRVKREEIKQSLEAGTH
jgi:tetratricopeptide (TPR) repeat protein